MKCLRPAAFLALLLLPAAVSAALADYKLAVAYYSQGNYQKAIDELAPDLEANPTWEFGHRLTGLCHLALKNNSLAITSLSKAVQLKSTTSSVYIGLGQAYYNLDRFDKCLEALTQGESFAKDPEKYRLYRLKGSCHFRLKKYPEAIAEINRAMQYKVGEWGDYYELGMAFYHIEQTAEAVQALSKAVAMKPDHAPSLEILGKCYFKQGITALSTKQYESAQQLFQKASESNPKDPYAYYNLAEALLFLKKYPEAEKSLNQVLALQPQSGEAYQRLGLVFEKQKKWKQALGAYQKAESIKPAAANAEAIKRLQAAAKNPQ